MAITSCAGCGKKVSSQSALCPHCGFEMGEVSEEDRAIFQARRLRDRIYRLNMLSYLVITVFVAAFGWYWWASAGFTEPSPAGPFILMGLSAVAYLTVRGFLFYARQKRNALRRRRQMSSDLRRNL